MKTRAVTAAAPTRIDLAGGTLDIWPLSMIVPDAVTLNLAVELRARATVEPRSDGRIVIRSLDRRRRAERRLPLRISDATGPLSLLFRLVRAFEPRRGLTITIRAQAPAGAGLGGSSALVVAAAAALDRFTGAGLARAELLRRAMNVETTEIEVPTGNQDYLAAMHGGLSAWHHTVDGTSREKLPIPEGLEDRLVLAYTGEPRQSGFSNWDVFRRFVENETQTVRKMESIARLAREMQAALLAGDLRSVGRLLGEEGKLRYRLAPSVATPALRRADDAARAAGALGAKVCGAGGGGCLVAFAAEGRTRAVAAALRASGARVLPCEIATRGLSFSAP
jgi:D-glycero-alpha-D-manno-heptose-7-phosphate kinase